jgi:hypothetical protein
MVRDPPTCSEQPKCGIGNHERGTVDGYRIQKACKSGRDADRPSLQLII